MKPALLVIDVQKAFFGLSPATAQSLKDAIEYINAAIALFREKGLPVICVQHMKEEDQLVPGQEGFDLPEELHILPSDLHIHKTYGNAFNKTPLAAHLRDLGVDTVIITGFCAEYCVLSTCGTSGPCGATGAAALPRPRGSAGHRGCHAGTRRPPNARLPTRVPRPGRYQCRGSSVSGCSPDGRCAGWPGI
ncbi:MAG: cysteine hydrolase [Chloroflexi bacterium]|nr:cysteine hydrolase [Chloroflexota bacterium]